MLETNVMESDLFVAMITNDYLNFANCRKELTTALHNKKLMILLLDAGASKGDTKPMTAKELRVHLSRLDEEVGEFTQKEHNAAERLIKVIESGSMEHLKKKELSDLLKLLQACHPSSSPQPCLRISQGQLFPLCRHLSFRDPLIGRADHHFLCRRLPRRRARRSSSCRPPSAARRSATSGWIR